MTAKISLVRRDYVGKRLRVVLDGFSWSDVDAASDFKVSQQTVKNWLADASRMTEIHLRRLERLEKRLDAKRERAAE